MHDFEELVVHVCKYMKLSVYAEIPEHMLKDSHNESLNILKYYLIEKHHLSTWRTLRLTFGILFLVYTVCPILGFYCTGFTASAPLWTHFANMDSASERQFLEINSDQIILIRAWSLISILGVVGLISASRVSIRKLRRKFLTRDERLKHYLD
jgi:hypothetical protein